MTIPVRTDPWVPPYNVVGMETLASNLRQIFERDQVEALDWASPGVTLPPFVAFPSSNRINQEHPVCATIPSSDSADWSESRLVSSEYTLDIQIEDTGEDLDTLVTTMLRRVRAVRCMIWAASGADLLADIDRSRFALESLTIGRAVFTSFATKAQDNYWQYAVIPLTFKCKEN